MSDHNDVCLQSGFSANDDAEMSLMEGWIDSSLLSGVKDELSAIYNIQLDSQEIQEIMEAEGINFGYEREYSVADLIYESLNME